MLVTTHGYSRMALGITTLSSCQTSTSPTGWLVLVVVVVSGLESCLTTSYVVARVLRLRWRGGDLGGGVEDPGTVGGEGRTPQVPHSAQYDRHPNQDYPSFASYLAPFSYHQAFVVSLDLLEIP